MKNKRKHDDRDIVNTIVKKHKTVDKKWPDEMTPEAAKRIEKMQEKWREDSDKIQRQQALEREELLSKHSVLPHKSKPGLILPPLRDDKPLTVAEAKRLDKLQDKLIKETESVKSTEVEQSRAIEKKQEPIVKAIKEQTETIKTAEKPKRVPILRNLTKEQLKPRPTKEQFRPRASSTPGRSNISVTARERSSPLLEEAGEENVFDAPTGFPPTGFPPTGFPPTPAPTSAPEQDELQNRSIRQFTEDENIGYTAKRYLASGNDRVFGIYFDFNHNKLAIGSQTISIENDDIILDDTMDRYIGTEGLWKLLTMTEIQSEDPTLEVGLTTKMRLISSGAFTSKDFEKYKEILIKTHALYQNNNPASNRPKSSGSWKWTSLISDIWRGIKEQKPSGKGLLVDTDNPVEYKYIDDYDKLVDRINFIRAQEEAGNNNFNNEKLAIAKLIDDRTQQIVDKPQGDGVEGGDVVIKKDAKIHWINFGLASDRKKQMRMFD